MSPSSGSRKWRRVLTLASLVATTCLAGTPLDTVQQCATTAPIGLHGLKALHAVCPDLQAALGTLGLDTILYEGWQDNLNVHALQDVLDLEERYSRTRGPSLLDTSALARILQSLRDEQAAPGASWWHSFKNWIKHRLEQSDSAIAKWIKHLLDGVLGSAPLSRGFLQAFVYVVTIFTALGALAIIAYELNAAGVLQRFAKRRSAASPSKESAGHSAAAEESGAHGNGPAAVLRALVMRLLQTGRLSTERSLTHRELIARSTFDSEGQKSVFARVAHCAEGILYGSKPAAGEIQDTVTREGSELLRQLSTTAGTP